MKRKLIILILALSSVIWGCMAFNQDFSKTTSMPATKGARPENYPHDTAQEKIESGSDKVDKPAKIVTVKINELKNCIEPKSKEALPSRARIGEVLFLNLQDETIYLAELEGDDCVVFPQVVNRQIVGSPDKRNIVYVTGEEVHHYNVGEKSDELINISYDEVSANNLSGWVNDNTIAFSQNGEVQPLGYAMINLEKREVQILNPSYPQIFSWGTWRWGSWNRTIYNGSLKFVVYPAIWNEEQWAYVLWDIEENKIVSTMNAGFGSYPAKWAPDGKKYVGPVGLSKISMMDINGKMDILVDLKNVYPGEFIEIQDYTWSPDSKRIAFFLDHTVNQKRSANETPKRYLVENLYVVSSETQELIDLGEFGVKDIRYMQNLWHSSVPIWSPDGSYFLIEDRLDENESELVIIDIETGARYMIGKNLSPIDWLSRAEAKSN